MQVHEFSIASVPDMPWKNGRGRTRELARWPAGSDLESFGWRVSIATITESGPFSIFEGVDRTILLLCGRGVHLRSGDGRIDRRLDTRWEPFSFAGEVIVNCEALGGESRDFNVMTRRRSYLSETRILRENAMRQSAPFGLLLALSGTWQVTSGSATYCLRADAGLWWEEGGASNWSLSPDGASGREQPALIAVRWKESGHDSVGN
jgi:environmental stress-induced protein Ves